MELTAFGRLVKSQSVRRSVITHVEAKQIVPSLFGQGGGINLVFRSHGNVYLEASLVKPKDAEAIVQIVSH